MADRFINDDGSNTSPFDTWAKAATTMATAVSGSSAGDDFFIGNDHAEAPGVSKTYTFPGTAAAPNRVISTTVGTSTYNKADNVQIDLGTGVFDGTINGHVKFYGFSIKIGDDFVTQGSNQVLLFDDCLIEFNRVSQATWDFGGSGGQNSIKLKNTIVNFSGGGSSSGFALRKATTFTWDGGSLLWGGAQPTILFNGASNKVIVRFAGVDISSISSSLVDVSDASDQLIEFHHCVIDSAVSLTSGVINSAGTKVMMSGVDDSTGNKIYRFEYVDFYGSIVHDDAIFRTAGANDGVDSISWKMITTANAKEFSEPLISPPIVARVTSTGSKTFTVEVNWDNAVSIENDEMWLEIEYLEAAADTDSAFADDGLVDILTAPVVQATSTEGWTGTGGFANEQKRKLEVVATVNRIGPVICRVHLAKPSVTVYADPRVKVA